MKRRHLLKTAWAIMPVLAVGLLAACAPKPVSIIGKAVGIRFGIVTDVHYADCQAREGRPFRESLAKMEECIAVMNRERVDFLIELGDFKDQDEVPVETKTLIYLRRIESAFGRFLGPRYHVLGNHDLDSLSKEQFMDAIENTGIPKGWSFYGFDGRGVRFLVLDANFDAKSAPYDHGRFGWADANIPAHEIDWLRSELVASSKPVVVFIHQQLDGAGYYCVKNAAKIRSMLEQSGKVLAVFQGHRHEGGYSRIGGIHYYTLKAMIEGLGPENNSYAVVEIAPSGDMIVRGFRKADSLTLEKIKKEAK